MKGFLLACIIAPVVIVGLWAIAIPEDFIISLMENSLRESNLHVEAKGLKKGLFYNLKSERIWLKKSEEVLLLIDNVAVGIHPSSLLQMKLTASFHGEISGGNMDGEWDLLKGKDGFRMRLDNSNMEGILLFSILGLSGRGILSAEYRSKGGTGDLRFSMRDAKFEGKSYSGIRIPLDLFHSAKGLIAMKGDVIHVGSLSLEGDGLYARVKGDIMGDRVDLTIELMPDSSFKDKSNIFSQMKNFQVSPGHYVIPLKSSMPLSRPCPRGLYRACHHFFMRLHFPISCNLFSPFGKGKMRCLN